MNKRIKAIVISIASITVAMITNNEVSAYTKNEVSPSSEFKKAWEYTIDYYSSVDNKNVCIGTMVYGFDTVVVNEDYCWASSTKCKYQAILTNGWGTKVSAKKSAGKSWAKQETAHKGKDITYAMWLSSTYSDISSSKIKSNTK